VSKEGKVKINFEDERPIYVQVAESIEKGILIGAYAETKQVPSTTEISVTYKINPATALKGINRLVDEGLLYKQRGVGMFVAKGAAKKVEQKRKDAFYGQYVKRLTKEAKRLNLTVEETKKMIERSFSDEQD
jgi:DNA-binding transcriptional regulator YhcF (GntR family)